MKRTLALATMITLGAAAWTPLPSMAQIGLNLVINATPPAPRFETVPAARRGYDWAPGYWNWDGDRHTWRAGHWENARDGYRLRAGGWQPVATHVRPGYVYSQPNWQQRNGRWFMEPSRWTPRGGGGRDRDRDGVPGRFEHGRDADGVPNNRDNRDNRPDNGRRN